jgi:hypothetical protein
MKDEDKAQTCDFLPDGWLFFFEQESTKTEAKPGGMEVERYHNGLYLVHAAFVGGICRYESFEEAATKFKDAFKDFDATAFYQEIGSPKKKDRPATKTSAAQKPAAKTRSAPQSKTTKDTFELLHGLVERRCGDCFNCTREVCHKCISCARPRDHKVEIFCLRRVGTDRRVYCSWELQYANIMCALQLDVLQISRGAEGSKCFLLSDGLEILFRSDHKGQENKCTRFQVGWLSPFVARKKEIL